MTIPSQVRYVYYYGRSILEPAKRNYQNRTLSLEKIVFKGVPDMSNGTSIPAFVIRHGPEQVVTYKSPWFEVRPPRVARLVEGSRRASLPPLRPQSCYTAHVH